MTLPTYVCGEHAVLYSTTKILTVDSITQFMIGLYDAYPVGDRMRWVIEDILREIDLDDSDFGVYSNRVKEIRNTRSDTIRK